MNTRVWTAQVAGPASRPAALAGPGGATARSFVAPLAVMEGDAAAPLVHHQVGQVEAHEIADPTAGVQQHGEDRSRPHVLAQFDFTEQPPDLGAVEALRCKNDPAQFLDHFGRVGGDHALLTEPTEEAAQGDERPIDGADGLALLFAQVVTEVGDVTSGDTLHKEAFSVGLGEPVDELAQVLGQGLAGVVGQVVGIEVAGDQGGFFWPGGDGGENLIARTLHG